MQTATPTTITIELQRKPQQRTGWTARTRVTGGTVPTEPITVVASVPHDADVTVTPAAYEPGPCTCAEGLCDRDHEHE